MTTGKTSAAVIIGLALLFLFRGCIWSDDAGVKIGRYFSVFDFVNVHSSPRHWLSIKGREYGPLKGKAPYYLKVEALAAIFFVTTGKDTDEFAHLVFLKDGSEISIPVNYGFDSYSLGAPQSAYRSLRIARATWPDVYIESKDGEKTKMHRFNFAKATWTVEKEEPNQALQPTAPSRRG